MRRKLHAMRIVTWNVNGIRARQAEVLAWTREHEPEVVCLQEIKAEKEKVPAELASLPGYWCYWHGQKGYSGVSLHVSKRFCPEEPAFSHPEFDHDKRIVVTVVRNVSIASIYVPNGGTDFEAKMRFLEALDAYAARQREEGRTLVLCGDFNVARADIDVHPKERKLNAIGQRPDERTLLERVLGRGLTDVARSLDPDNDRLFTWWAPWRNLRQRDVGWRLDYVLASAPLAARATECRAYREFGSSDHAPVLAKFDL